MIKIAAPPCDRNARLQRGEPGQIENGYALLWRTKPWSCLANCQDDSIVHHVLSCVEIMTYVDQSMQISKR